MVSLVRIHSVLVPFPRLQRLLAGCACFHVAMRTLKQIVVGGRAVLASHAPFDFTTTSRHEGTSSLPLLPLVPFSFVPRPLSPVSPSPLSP
jgi:hypothetical protein